LISSFLRVLAFVFDVRVEAEFCLVFESSKVEESPQKIFVAGHTHQQLGVVGSERLSWMGSIRVELGYSVGSIATLVGLRHPENLQIFYPVSSIQI
jgi:hypothetical protein